MYKRLLIALAICFVAPSQADVFKIDRVGGQNHRCVQVVGGIDVTLSQHSEEKEAIESCLEQQIQFPDATFDVVTDSRILVRVNFDALAQSYPGANNSYPPLSPATNDPPIWTDPPVCNFTEGVAGSCDLVPDFVNDPEGDTLTIADAGGCTLPTGVTVDDTNDQLDASTGTSAGTTTGCTLTANDGTNPSQTSPAFPITIAAAGGGTGYEDILDEMVGFADHHSVTGGQGGPLVTVTNLNDSGAGSLRAAVAAASGATWIRFAQGLSGTITLDSDINMVDDITIDGRGASITIQAAGGGQRIFDARSDQENFILMYMTLLGNVAGGQDTIGIENPKGTPSAPHSERFWLYHLTMVNAGDELVGMSRTEGKGTIQACKMTSNLGDRKGVLVTHGSTSEGWDAVQTKVTFHRNHWDDVGQRMPRIGAPANIHQYNDYMDGYSNTPTAMSTAIDAYPNFPAEYLGEENIYENGSSGRVVSHVTLGGQQNSKAKIVGGLFLSGSTANDERDPNNVFTPPYAYTAATASTALRDAIVAEAGNVASTFPGDP